MKTTFWLPLVMVVATATCQDSEDGSQDSTIPPEYSRVNQEVYRASAIRQTGSRNSYITPPPLPRLPPVPTRQLSRPVSGKPEEYSKPKGNKPPQTSTTQKTGSSNKKQNENDGRQTYGIQNYSTSTENEEVDPCTQEYNDPEPEPMDYPAPTVPSTNAPQFEQPTVVAQETPIFVRRPAIFAPQPPVYRAVVRAIRRGLRQPTYRRLFNPAQPVYRPLDYARPVTYAIPIPSARRVVYEPAAVRYVQSPNIGYDGAGGLDYENVLNVDYEEVKK